MANRVSAAIAVLVLFPVCLLGQATSKPAATAAPQSRPAGVFAMKDMRVDIKKRTVTIDATVCNSDYALEFLLCAGKDKGYESLLRTDAKPSHIHAALLMLGLVPGKPAKAAGGEEGKFIPPRGPEMTITLRWKDKDGNAREADASQWLTAAAEGKKAAFPKSWVFVGSEILPDRRYAADIDMGIISVANLPSAVIDVPFESTRTLEQREFKPDKGAMPEVGTAVEIVIAPLAGAEKSPHARVMLEIDREGSLRLEGKPIARGELAKWAEAYIKEHAKGLVVIRADGLASVNDVETARRELQFNGVREFDEEFLPPDGPLLPRTAQQAKEVLDQWAGKFKNPREFINDPAEEAQWTLDQIEQRLAELESQKKLWQDYEGQLRRSLAGYRGSTQPSPEPRP